MRITPSTTSEEAGSNRRTTDSAARARALGRRARRVAARRNVSARRRAGELEEIARTLGQLAHRTATGGGPLEGRIRAISKEAMHTAELCAELKRRRARPSAAGATA